MDQDRKFIALGNSSTAKELQILLPTMQKKAYFVKEVVALLVQKQAMFESNKTASAVINFLHLFAVESETPLQTKEVTDMIIFNLVPKVDRSSVYCMAAMINNINCSATTLYGTKEAADALIALLQKATSDSVEWNSSAILSVIQHTPAAKSFFTTPAAMAAITGAVPLANEAENVDSVLLLLDKLLEGNCHLATPELLESVKTLEQRCESEPCKQNYKTIVDKLEFEVPIQLLVAASTNDEFHVAVEKVLHSGYFIERVRDQVLRKQALAKSEVTQSAVGRYLQLYSNHNDTNPRPVDVVPPLRDHIHIDDSVTPSKLLLLQSVVDALSSTVPGSEASQLLHHALTQQKTKERDLRVEVAAFHPSLAWAASTFPQVAELSVLNSRLLIINNFNLTSISNLEKEIDHAKKLISVVLDANTRSLIDSVSYNDCVNDQNAQKINALSQCWLAIRVAELETTMFETRKFTADEHLFGMLKSAQLEFLQRVQIEEAAVKLDFFNRSCIAAFIVHHYCSRQEIRHQEEEQQFVLNHDCVFDNIVIEEHFACRIMLSHALDSSFSSSVREETSAHRVIMREFELAQQRVRIQIDERIARELSFLEEERTIRQIVEDTHLVGCYILVSEESSTIDYILQQFGHGVQRAEVTLDERNQRAALLQDRESELCPIIEETHSVLHGLLLGDESAEFGELVEKFTTANAELAKYEWFRFACCSLGLSFTLADFPMEKIIQKLSEEYLQKDAFLDVSDVTLRACGFPGAVITSLRKIIDHLTRGTSFVHAAVHPLLDEVKSQLPGVLVLPPAEVGLRKNRDNKLGTGGYGDVYKATIVSQRNRRCAAKIFYDKDIAIQEAKNLFHLDHPNVVRLLGVTVEDTPNPSVVLLFELADCDLKRFIKSKLPLRKIRRFIKQIAQSLEYLHQADRANGKPSIVHLDLKPENILVFRIGTSIILKISDLGFVHEMETSTSGHRTTFAATERYLSPETRIDRRKCRKNSKHNVRIFPAIDIFAFGIILLQMIAPTWYKRQGREQVQTKMDDVIHNEALLQSNECCIDDFKSEVGDCDDLVKLVKDCLMINRKIRPQNGAALLLRLTSAASANGDDFDVVNDSDDECSSSSDDDESVSDESDDEGGDNSTSNRVRNSRSDVRGDEVRETNTTHQTNDGEDDDADDE